MTLPAPDTQAYQILALTAICGELPASLIPRLAGGDRYKELVIQSLKKEKLLTVFAQDHLRGYRLGRRAKALLLTGQPDRFSFFLSGSSDTNRIKCGEMRRVRLHRVAASTLLAMNAGARVFRDEKPDVFAPSVQPCLHTADFTVWEDQPLFYSSREVKEMGLDAVRIRSSRMTGLLLTPSEAFLLCQGGVQMPKLDHKTEQRTRSFLRHTLCGSRFAGKYGLDCLRTVLVCEDLQTLVEILQGAYTPRRNFFALEDHSSGFYYLSNDHKGDVLLRLLCAPERRARLSAILAGYFCAPNPNLYVENDALDAQGNPVLFACLPDVPRLARFLSAFLDGNGKGSIVCFDFQAQALRSCCGENVAIMAISFDRFEKEGLL